MKHDLLTAAQNGLAVVDVYLRESNAVVYQEHDPISENAPKLAFQHKFFVKKTSTFRAPEGGDGFRILRFYVATGLRLLPPNLADEEKEPNGLGKHIRAEITAEFVSEYKIIKPDLSQEAIDEFGKYNTMLHIWPYWRELIQSMCARMRLAQIVLPMYRVEPENSEKKASESKNEKNV